MPVSVICPMISKYKYDWIAEPPLVFEHLFKEAGVSINLKCYDNNEIETRANQRNEWIA